MSVKIFLDYIKRCEKLGVEPTLDGLNRYHKEIILEEYNTMV